jgi:hypothetical protein
MPGLKTKGQSATKSQKAKAAASKPPKIKKKRHHGWCMVCRGADDRDKMLKCESCRNAGHMECLAMSDENGDKTFTCTECVENAEHEKNETPESRALREESKKALAERDARMEEIHRASKTARKTTLLRMHDHLTLFIPEGTLKKQTAGGVTLAKEASKKGNAGANGKTAVLSGPLNVDQQEHPGFFDADLRDYQVYGVEWILKQYNAGIGGILADEM